MAFGDGNKFWQADLTTRAGADNAAHQGGLACYILAGMTGLGAIYIGFTMGFTTPEGLAIIAFALVEAALLATAGYRLRAGQGAYWGIGAAVLAIIELIGKIATVSIGGMVIVAILAFMIIQGVRGAMALKRSGSFHADVDEVFR